MEKIDMSLDDIIKGNKKFKTKNNKNTQLNRGASKAHSAKFQKGNFKSNAKQLRKPLKGGITKPNHDPHGKRTFRQKQMSRMLLQQTKQGNNYKNQGGYLAMKRRNNAVQPEATNPSTTKLLISNLDFGVSNQDIFELFQDFGTLKKASLHFDETGKSLGSADVMFENSQDAMRALKHYDDVPLDGRPMKIQVVGSVKKPHTSLQSRLGSVRQTRGAEALRKLRTTGFGNKKKVSRVQGSTSGNRRFAGRKKKISHSKNSLDAQLDAYNSKKK